MQCSGISKGTGEQCRRVYSQATGPEWLCHSHCEKPQVVDMGRKSKGKAAAKPAKAAKPDVKTKALDDFKDLFY